MLIHKKTIPKCLYSWNRLLISHRFGFFFFFFCFRFHFLSCFSCKPILILFYFCNKSPQICIYAPSTLQAQSVYKVMTGNPRWKMGGHTVWNIQKQELVLCCFCPIHISWQVWLFIWYLRTMYYLGRILLLIQIFCLGTLSCYSRCWIFFINLE